MRIARVIGKLTLARAEASLKGARYLIAVPLSLESLKTGHASPIYRSNRSTSDGIQWHVTGVPWRRCSVIPSVRHSS